jgi:hypothetical protein
MSGGSVWWAYSPADLSGGWKPGYARLVVTELLGNHELITRQAGTHVEPTG